MNPSIVAIPFTNLAIAFIPVGVVLLIMHHWSGGYHRTLIPVARMLIQLLLIGYVLSYIFAAENAWIVLAVLAVMVSVSSWIGLRTLRAPKWPLFRYSLLAIGTGGGATLALIVTSVLELDPWYAPRYVIPLGGMIFFNAMNSVSLAAERLEAELDNGAQALRARHTAFRASMIPPTNALLAVGLVSLPGMMTGQILSGISPLVAVRYQIMVMCMTFGCAGMASACFLVLAHGHFRKSPTGAFRDSDGTG